jgi:hypothetical protein
MIVPIRASSCPLVSGDCSHSAATHEGHWHNSLEPQTVTSSDTRVRFPPFYEHLSCRISALPHYHEMLGILSQVVSVCESL